MKIFFDTMVYLHYRAIDQLDMTKLFGPPPHTVIVPRITVRELDKHKNTHNSRRIKERARKALKNIEQWIVSRVVMDGVAAEIQASFPSVDFAKHGLKSDWADDVLIAAVLQYKTDHPDDNVILVTQDTGPRVTASNLDLLVSELSEEYKLQEELDAVEKENRDLSKQIAELRNTLPRLVVGFEGTEGPGQHAIFSIEPPPISVDAEIANKKADLAKAYPHKHPPKPESIEKKPLDVVRLATALAMTNFDRIPAEEYDRYNREIDAYVERYGQYIRETWVTRAIMKRCIRFTVVISNTGNAPADDVDVLLHFPDGFKLITKERVPVVPDEPQPPYEPISRAQEMIKGVRMQGIRGMPEHLFYRFQPPQSSAFSIKKTNSYNVNNHYQRIKHGDVVRLPEMFLIFDKYETAASFNCEYTIRPVNLPSPVTGQLHFVIEKEGL